MTAPVPATIANDLINTINAEMVKSTHFRSASDLSDTTIQMLFRNAKKLIKADARVGYRVTGMIWQLCGDHEKMVYHFKNAMHLGDDKYAIVSSMSAGCINLGYFAEAQSHFAVCGDPRQGHFLEEAVRGLAIASYDRLCKHMAEAEKMGVDLSSIPRETIERAAGIFSKAGFSDDDAAMMLDIAGEVMREHRIFPSDIAQIDVADEEWSTPSCVYYTFRLPVSSEEAADMYDELSKRIAERISPIPDAFHISIREK
ncbi:MAG: hypothetical protein M0037_01565 [Betaproteobacteria bacterium]|nr:hypothetical protein [Betaproteobacteria bacterium]